MSAETIKSLFISLGFQPGGNGQQKFETTLLGVTRQVANLGAVLQGVALKAAAYTAKIVQGLGIEDNAKRGMGQFSAEYTAMAKAIGFDAGQAALASDRFVASFSSFAALVSMAQDKIGANMASGLAGSLDNLRKQILDNFPKIEQVITHLVKGLLELSAIASRVIYHIVQAVDGIIDAWNRLEIATKQVIVGFGAMVVSWRLLNAAFALSPIGRIIALAAALAALLEDYVTWKEGGKSLIDWSAWEPAIQYASKAIGSLGGDISQLFGKVNNLVKAEWAAIKALLQLINIDTAGFTGKWLFDQIIETARSAIKYVGALADVMTKLVKGDISGAWDSLLAASEIFVDSPPMQGVTAVVSGAYHQANAALNHYLPEFLGGTPAINTWANDANENLLNWLAPIFDEYEQRYKLPTGLLRGVAITESGGNPLLVSNAGAQGLFQFMPATANAMGLGKGEIFDPVKSAQAAAEYLAQLLQANGGDLDKALASYRWGIGNVQKYGMTLMPRDTREYIPKVRSNMPGATIQQETHITVNGASDAQKTADAIASKQDGVNSRTVQQINAGYR